LLLSAPRAEDGDRQRRAPALSSNGAAARRSAANAGSVMLTAELTRLNTDLLLRSIRLSVCLLPVCRITSMLLAQTGAVYGSSYCRTIGNHMLEVEATGRRMLPESVDRSINQSINHNFQSGASNIVFPSSGRHLVIT